MIGKSVLFTTSSSFTVPANVSMIYVTGLGGGCGGCSGTSSFGGGGGGGGGEVMVHMPYWCSPGDIIAVTVGAGGPGGIGNGVKGTAGGASNVGGRYAVLGAPSGWGTFGFCPQNGGGGGPKGADKEFIGQTAGNVGSIETPNHFGGSSGAGAQRAGDFGGGNAGRLRGGPCGVAGPSGQNPGGGGAASIAGTGGTGGTGAANGTVALGRGAGGGGSGGVAFNAGAGTAGYVLIEWIDA